MLWKTISIRRGCPLRRPVVVMSIVCPRPSAASISAFVATQRTIRARTRLFRSQLGKRSALDAVLVEVVGRKPRLQCRPPRRPLRIRDRVPRRVAVAPLHDPVLPKDPLEREAEALRGSPGRRVRCVALPLVAAVAELVEGVARGEVDRLRRLPRALE